MQLVYSGNIGSDLASFLLSSVTYDALVKNLDMYLEYYRECLISFVADLDPDTPVSLTIEDIKMEFKKSSLLRFIFASRAFPHTLIDKKDASTIDLKNFDLTNMEDVNKLMVETRAHGKKGLA
ncbi:TUBGCP6 [Lepeophtheirus salmonis]|uniref:TUBGCP6 n=1 Tax=Lepeophtheirus salmonis TaxID=72036 RepID=A0A7R8GZK3_LEPSM|nr:TUBGCP6 [Lepeophtheirus salmonis]CAF2754189.1 TUBGCP6 [Lepeophtheirus salmonis]